ncbi:gamma-glutamyltransferase family protein [Celerinatantimonas diazotrophica]|uniref:Gamma-glutamyltranspeptidase/glutathione hydrolase n=1 Tax=Celerinatantimonas diazotrophica TaxID=412034 RepID=A0A4R1J8U3_9GAMM|nr:gamma-glutamyltransferase family protein [Celerinatantimonas diazotrophica]TCK46764.1 gamma-glutamyltranspeptidase/glutathione hydrolase [Celerinatantimonas diazotrophica]CAG9295467.1 Oxamate amidohydrolase proenzyme [Celerinatantimonas diazotrophica]
MKHQIAFSAPHHQASEVGLELLRQGASATEAMVAAAAAISVLYPHMNGLGGDSFWLIQEPGKQPIAINGGGRSAASATIDWYREQGFSAIPERGGASALSVAGTISAWQQALELSQHWQTPLPLAELLAPAIELAHRGITVSESLQSASRLTHPALGELPAFAECFLPNGQTLKTGELFRNGALGSLLEHLGQHGLDDFYRGEAARQIAGALECSGSPLRQVDLAAHKAQMMQPLCVSTRMGKFYNLPLPTQGCASLIIVALMDRLVKPHQSEAMQIHLLVEATKQAFLVRDRWVCDPAICSQPITDYLTDDALDSMAKAIDPERALPWPQIAKPGDTVWMGCCDDQGRMVSFIQSLYWEFGSGVVIPEFGLLWNNRGVSFSLDNDAQLALAPKRLPFHTLNPALANLYDGRSMVYGTMGGEGQPQTQAAILWRYLHLGQSLAQSISAPRWLLGRTWGQSNYDLKLEAPLEDVLVPLRHLGHRTQSVPIHSEMMGHAGAIVTQHRQVIAAASDPRSDGLALIK